MSITTNYNGFVKILEEHCLYHFNGETLLIYITQQLNFDLFFEKTESGGYSQEGHKHLPMGELTGSVSGDFKILHFFFDPTSYGYESEGFVGEKCVLKLPIPRYSIESWIEEQPKKILNYESSQFHRFLNMRPNYWVDIDEAKNELKADALCDLSEVTLTSAFEIEGRKLLLRPSCRASWGGSRFDFKPMLSIEIEGATEEEFLWRLFFDLDAFVQYAFFRTNIHAETCCFEGDKKKVDFKALWSLEKDEGPEEIEKIHFDFIPWSTLYKHAGALFTAIDAKQLYLDHIGSNKTARNWINLNSVPTDGAAFEKSFEALYPNGFPHSEERLKAEKEVQKSIEPLKDRATGKTKDIYKGFLKNIRKEGLGDKIEYALNQFAPCLEQIKAQVQLTDEADSDIAQVCAGLRNHIDHGDVTEGITEKDASCFILLRALIYALQLKKAGYDENDIKTAIRCLFGIL
jgi:hypothetical protein